MSLRRKSLRTVNRLVRMIVSSLVGAAVVGIVLAIVAMERRPDLEPWHLAKLGAEYDVRRNPVTTLEGYLELEERLFAELETKVLDAVESIPGEVPRRFQRGSISDPDRWATNWNRSFVWTTEEPTCGVLLLHGLSDSPYSLRGIGAALHARGAEVVGLRLPGHGTAPSGLVTVTVEDWDGAVRLAMRDLGRRVGDRPIVVVGYSNGGALAVSYALAALDDATLPRPAGLVLISPAIGVTRLAALAAWQGRLGRILGLEKIGWQSIEPEYDPFKYSSFPINSGHQVRRLTTRIDAEMRRRAAAGALDAFPPVLAFQSAVDATVSTSALVGSLFGLLPGGRDHALVVFDMNRRTDMEPIMVRDPAAEIDHALRATTGTFDLVVVTNASEESEALVARRRLPDGTMRDEPIEGIAWPPGIFSLSHVALPFAPDDPLYGTDPHAENPGIHIGQMELRGERGVLRIPASDLLRLRWNPFHALLEKRLLAFVADRIAAAPDRQPAGATGTSAPASEER